MSAGSRLKGTYPHRRDGIKRGHVMGTRESLGWVILAIGIILVCGAIVINMF